MHYAVRRLLCLLGCLVPLALNGCSIFDDRDDALYGYEEDDDASLFSLDGVRETYNEVTGSGPNPNAARQLLQEAEGAYTAATQDPRTEAGLERFREAADKYAQAAERWPGSPVEEQSLYQLGECYFFSDQYPEADDAFGNLIKKHPHTRYLDRAQARRFEIARYWMAQHDHDPPPFYTVNITDESQPWRDGFGRAVKILDNIRLDDPTGRLADDATLAMGNAYFTEGRFLRADEYYSDLRKTFPNSEHQFRAHFLGLRSKLESYSGVEYSGKPLEEAEKLLKQISRQFPVEAQREHEYLAKAAAEIRYRQAERCWHRAQRHDRRAEFGAARMYYQTLARDFSDTSYADRAMERVRDIDGRPDLPPQRMGWLADWFPEETTVKPMIAAGSQPQRR